MALMESPPIGSSIVELNEKDLARKDPFYLAKNWIQWAYKLLDRIQATVQVLKTLALGTTGVGLNASIGATAIPLGGLSGGLMRVAWYARIRTPDPVASSLTVIIGWTEGGVALTLQGAAIVSNLVTSVQSGVIEIQVDPNSAITYATTYVSNTPGFMHYSLRISVDEVPQV